MIAARKTSPTLIFKRGLRPAARNPPMFEPFDCSNRHPFPDFPYAFLTSRSKPRNKVGALRSRRFARRLSFNGGIVMGMMALVASFVRFRLASAAIVACDE